MVKDVAATFLGGIWKMLLKVDYPGLDVSIAGVMIAFLLMRLSIALFKYLTGFSAGSSDYGKAADSVERYKSAKKWEGRKKIGFD